LSGSHFHGVWHLSFSSCLFFEFYSLHFFFLPFFLLLFVEVPDIPLLLLHFCFAFLVGGHGRLAGLYGPRIDGWWKGWKHVCPIQRVHLTWFIVYSFSCWCSIQRRFSSLARLWGFCVRSGPVSVFSLCVCTALQAHVELSLGGGEQDLLGICDYDYFTGRHGKWGRLGWGIVFSLSGA